MQLPQEKNIVSFQIQILSRASSSTGKFGYKVKRDTSLSPKKYFDQLLLNNTQKFASDSDYIFYAHPVLQNIHLN